MRGLSQVVASGGHSSSRCAGLSLSRPLVLRSTSSRRVGSVVVAHGPSCSVACGIFPDQGSNPCPLHWQADSQPLRHQGSPLPSILNGHHCSQIWLLLLSAPAPQIWNTILSPRYINTYLWYNKYIFGFCHSYPLPYFVLCVSSIWLFLSCILFNKTVIRSMALSWVLWVIQMNYWTCGSCWICSQPGRSGYPWRPHLLTSEVGAVL